MRLFVKKGGKKERKGSLSVLVLGPEEKITKIRETGDINAVSRIKQNTSGVFICRGSHSRSHLLYEWGSASPSDGIIT